MTSFRDIRRKDRALTEDQARDILARAEHGVLATLGADGWPYGIPVNHVLSGNVLYIHCAAEGHKLANIAHEERVSFCVVTGAQVLPATLSTLYESARRIRPCRPGNGSRRETASPGASGHSFLRVADARSRANHRRLRRPGGRRAHPSRENHRQGPSFRVTANPPDRPGDRHLCPGPFALTRSFRTPCVAGARKTSKPSPVPPGAESR